MSEKTLVERMYDAMLNSMTNYPNIYQDLSLNRKS